MSSEEFFEAFRRAEALLANRRPLEALRALGPVLEENPDTHSVQILAGRAYLHTAQFARAEQAFTAAVDLDPADHYARLALGRTLQRQGRFTEALTQIKMAAAMHPTPEYQDALGEVSARVALQDR
ncbi:tetratricopeptide repeat protein [Actinoalloteichus hymeniacidonis]|jgi:predicted Zn-dependent protease|uniref:Tetratricopeptide repeat n=1 Tax=Actinoalloteichus hymeniacidonis TaxID=340345 RepID=A0AAC9HLZ5_9PSEU|nr:tetratricopeptide repeat protein [Actinoalloteichus hymeniacidonis]AOS61584.1 Tetratricopeptide repeat [Actinoalloteichus hymeniacidonis]MBB5910406.1 putative Zn-dependent protease [Actinoalloteichus hymeniacidonis]